MKPTQVKIALTAGAFLLFVLLFNANRIAPSKKDAMSMNKATASNSATIEVYASIAEKNLTEETKAKFDFFKKGAEKNPANFDSIATLWDNIKKPDVASLYMEKKAIQTKKAADWFMAGNRYYYSVPFIKDETELPILYESAVRCFKKGLELDPKDNDAKIMLASCYVEGTTNPMDGITLLKEVEQVDSNNVKLQLAFAFFSVKSNQMDKAIKRFNKVLEVDPNYIEAYLHLADIYEQMGNTEKTIEALEKYAAKTNDPMSKSEVEKYIKQLKLK